MEFEATEFTFTHPPVSTLDDGEMVSVQPLDAVFGAV